MDSVTRSENSIAGSKNYYILSLLQLFVDCIEELQSDCPLKVNASLLLGAAAFERALGDVSSP